MLIAAIVFMAFFVYVAMGVLTTAIVFNLLGMPSARDIDFAATLVVFAWPLVLPCMLAVGGGRVAAALVTNLTHKDIPKGK